jgi:hypothetical protein
VKKGKRKPGAETHGPGAGYDQGTESSDYTSEQVNNIRIYIATGHRLRAPEKAILAALCAGFGENSWNTYGCNPSNHCGTWQLDSDWQAMHSYLDVPYWTDYAYQKGFYGGNGGLIKIADDHPGWSIGEMTQACQGAGPSDAAAAAYYQGQLPLAEGALRTYGDSADKLVNLAAVGGGGGGAPAGAPALSSGNPSGLIKSTDWAGNVENAFKFIRGGSDEAAHISGTTKDRVVKLAVIGWTGEKKK